MITPFDLICFPVEQGAVGISPKLFINDIPVYEGLDLVDQLTLLPVQGNRPLTRKDIRLICRDFRIHPLVAYACVMAWGGANRVNFRDSVSGVCLKYVITLVEGLRSSSKSRQQDFDFAQEVSSRIDGLGISFYTKMLYFFRLHDDAYILDQWTAKSACLMTFPHVIRLSALNRRNGFAQAALDTSSLEYENFCSFIDGLAANRVAGFPSINGADVEVALFDEGYGRGKWRNFVSQCFKHEKVGPLIHQGAQSITTLFDWNQGVFRIATPSGEKIFSLDLGSGDLTASNEADGRMISDIGGPIGLDIALNYNPQYYVGLKRAGGRANIGYISRANGEICVYHDLHQMLRQAGFDGALEIGGMRHAGPVGQHAGNISVFPKNLNGGIEFLRAYFNI